MWVVLHFIGANKEVNLLGSLGMQLYSVMSPAEMDAHNDVCVRREWERLAYLILYLDLD